MQYTCSMHVLLCISDSYKDHTCCSFQSYILLFVWFMADSYCTSMCICACLSIWLCCLELLFCKYTSVGDDAYVNKRKLPYKQDRLSEEDETTTPLLSADNATYISTSHKQKPTPIDKPLDAATGIRQHISNNNGSPLQKRTADTRYENIDYINQV